jgi:hypothetical protein
MRRLRSDACGSGAGAPPSRFADDAALAHGSNDPAHSDGAERHDDPEDRDPPGGTEAGEVGYLHAGIIPGAARGDLEAA